MKKLIFTALSAFMIFASVEASAQKLVIAHVNDTHSHLDPEREGEDMGHGGVIERAAYIDDLRKTVGKNKVLFLHAGDWNQGSSYFNVLGGVLEANLVNALDYDCLTLGNHEFDNGLEDLAARIDIIDAPVVCANYDFSGTPLETRVKPYTIIKRGGMKIGIVGALPDIMRVVDLSIASRLKPLDNRESINKWADKLKLELGCDLVILLSHLGYSEDLRITSELHNVDLIVGGHSHTKVDDLKYNKDADGDDVPTIQDYRWGLEVGRIDVY